MQQLQNFLTHKIAIPQSTMSKYPAMNRADGGPGYLGQTDWQLPETGPPDPSCSMKGTTDFDCTGSPMAKLSYKQLGLHRDESAVATPDLKVAPFHDIQPYLYSACETETAVSAC